MTDNFELPRGENLQPEIVENALREALGEDLAQQILQSIVAKTQEAKEHAQLRLIKLNVANLGIAAHLNCSEQEPPSMLDIISWERFTRDTSYDLLYKASKTEGIIPESALRFAACYASFRALFDGSGPEEAEEILENTGYTLEKVHETIVDSFAALATEAGQGTTRDDILKDLPNAEALEKLNWPSGVFTFLEKEMYKELAEKGYTLPELSEDGSYGLEPGKDGSYAEDFSTPTPNDMMLPV